MVIQEVIAGSVTFEETVTKLNLPPEGATRLANLIAQFRPRETVTIAVSSLASFEAAAQFLALLIYPVDVDLRQRLILAECHRYVRHCVESDPRWAQTRQFLPPAYQAFSPKLAQKIHKKAVQILGQRIVSAGIALVLIAEAIAKARGADGLLLRENGEDLARFSTLEPLFAWGLRQERLLAGRPDDPDKGDPKTFQQRPWKESKPVLHLALAYLIWTKNKTAADLEASWAALFVEPCRLGEFLDQAEGLRQLLLTIAPNRKLKYSVRDTIRVVAG
jgi:hypothetical protein